MHRGVYYGKVGDDAGAPERTQWESYIFTSECSSRDIAEAIKYGPLLLVTER